MIEVDWGSKVYRALLVCNSAFPEDPAGLPALKGPRVDGLMLWRTLTDPSVGMFLDENVTVMYERTSREILEAVEEFFGSATSKDRLILYYSGHGMRAAGKLYLCGRDTAANRLVSSGVPAGAIRDVIEQSKALSTAVILDCCHSGAFKGADQVVDDFKGSGTYVLAASRASELAEDSLAVGSSSPFTGALVEALLVRAVDVNNDGYLDLDDIYRAMYEILQELEHPEPRKHFDGSGSIAIGRVPQVAAGDNEAGDDFEEVVPAEQPAVALRSGEAHFGDTGTYISSTPLKYRRRSTGSYSLGDIHSWCAYMVASLVVTVYALLLINESLSGGFDVDVPETIGFVCVAVLLLESLVLLLSLTEALLMRRRLDYWFGRREAMIFLEAKPLSWVRRVRDVLSISLGGVALFTISDEFQLIDERWVVMIALIAAMACSSVVSVSRRGDALYLGGAVVMLISPFLPLYSSDGVESTGILHLLLGGGMVLGWGFRIERTGLAMLALGGVLVYLIAFTNGEVVGATVGTTGACVSLGAAVIGCGEQLQDGARYARSVLLTLIRLFVGVRSPQAADSD